MTDPTSIIAAVCDEMNSTGFSYKPRIVKRADFDLTGFKEQGSDFDGVTTEWVRQTGPGVCGDDYQATVAVPIDADRFFVIGCDS